MKIRFQADNDLDEDIVRAAKRLQPGLDFQRAVTLGLHTGVPDLEVLALCASEDRMLVTHDRKTIPSHFREWISAHDSPGVFIVSRRVSIGAAAEWLVLYWATCEAEEFTNQIIDIP